MAAAEEEQIREMLESMGVSSVDESEVLKQPTPVAKETAVASAAADVMDQAQLDALFTGDGNKGNKSSSVDNGGAGKGSAVSGEREFSVAALIHLLGLPTRKQIDMIEGRIDALEIKLNSAAGKLERIVSQAENARNDSVLDRIDFQLSDIRAVLRKFALGVAVSRDETNEEDNWNSESPTILTNKSGDKTEENELGANKQEQITESTEDEKVFQQSEGDRIRGVK